MSISRPAAVLLSAALFSSLSPQPITADEGSDVAAAQLSTAPLCGRDASKGLVLNFLWMSDPRASGLVIGEGPELDSKTLGMLERDFSDALTSDAGGRVECMFSRSPIDDAAMRETYQHFLSIYRLNPDWSHARLCVRFLSEVLAQPGQPLTQPHDMARSFLANAVTHGRCIAPLSFKNPNP